MPIYWAIIEYEQKAMSDTFIKNMNIIAQQIQLIGMVNTIRNVEIVACYVVCLLRCMPFRNYRFVGRYHHYYAAHHP